MQLGMTSTKIPDPQLDYSSDSDESSDSSESDEDRQPPVKFQEPSPWQLAYNAFDKIVMEYKTKLAADLVAKQQEYIDTIEASEKYLTHHFADKYLDLTKQFTAKQHELIAQQKATMQELKDHKEVMVSRDALIVKLHNDVSERDALVAKLHNDIAERDALFVKLHLQNEAKEPDSSVVSRREQPAVVKRKKCEKADSGHYNTRGKDKA
jgi:septal ring factor EnvC (AmiA/AmiB activator)